MFIKSDERFTLNQLPKGMTAVVADIEAGIREGLPLLEWGILPGAEVAVQGRSSLGDLTTYRVRDTMIALRREQASHIAIHLTAE